MTGRTGTASMGDRWPDEQLDIPEPSAVRTISEAEDIKFVNGHEMKALLTKEDIKAHLRLLGAFKHLCQDVVSYEGVDANILKGADALTVFIARAVWRAEKWFQTLSELQPEDLGDSLPPPDVLLVWHAYLMNPRKYFEDATRWTPALYQKIGDFPLEKIVATIEESTFTFMKAESTRAQDFFDRTGQPFDVERPGKSDNLKLTCPCCKVEIKDVSWWKGDESTGYAQTGFNVMCSNCNRNITMEVFGLRKFAEDVERIRSDQQESDPQTNTLAHLFASTKYGIRTKESEQASKQVNSVLLQNISSSEEAVLDWDVSRLRPLIQQAVKETKFDDPFYVDRCCRCYSYPEHFSVELRGSVTRQQTMLSEVDEIKWSRPGYPGLKDNHLSKALLCYHMALEFMRAKPESPLVPTMVLDLAWHTHLLFHQSYRTSTLRIVESLVEHDDDVEFSQLLEPFERTKENWKDYFGTDYSFDWARPAVEYAAAQHEVEPVRTCIILIC